MYTLAQFVMQSVSILSDFQPRRSLDPRKRTMGMKTKSVSTNFTNV